MSAMTDPRCGDCLRTLVANAARMATRDRAPDLEEIASKRALRSVEEGLSRGLASPVIANRALREITNVSGTPDPFAEFKRDELERARDVYASIRDLVRDDLRSCVELAVLGNTLDFFRDPGEVLQEVPALLRRGLTFEKDDVGRLEAFLSQRPSRVLYLTDNTGEVFFDLPLYEALSARAKRCTLVLKGGPSLNDLTRRELRMSGLEARYTDVADTGTDGAGIDWDRVSEGFESCVADADLILAKGMANFETMYPKTLPIPVFFLFRVKCLPIQDMIGVTQGSFAALWKEGGSTKGTESNQQGERPAKGR